MYEKWQINPMYVLGLPWEDIFISQKYILKAEEHHTDNISGLGMVSLAMLYKNI